MLRVRVLYANEANCPPESSAWMVAQSTIEPDAFPTDQVGSEGYLSDPSWSDVIGGVPPQPGQRSMQLEVRAWNQQMETWDVTTRWIVTV